MRLQVSMILLASLIWIELLPTAPNQNKDENHAPSVSVSLVAPSGKVNWNQEVQYSIHVSDKEDGDSKYDEIANQAVILSVLYLEDTTQAKIYLKSPTEVPSALKLMMKSTCFNCHTSQSKLIGPTFHEIAARYSNNEVTISSLSTKVIQGASSSWGEAKMPSNPEVKVEDAKEMVRWILTGNSNPNRFYLSGLNGTFRIKEKNIKNPHGVYLLTASYTDRGLPGKPNLSKQGQHVILVKPGI